jgi:hypothetical protein
MALTKTVQATSLFPIAVVSAGTVNKSAAFDCTTNFTATFYIDWSPIATTATPVATEWRIESSEVDSLDIWTPVYSRLTYDIAPNNPNVSVAAAGTNSITVSNGTGMDNGQWVFFYDSGTITESEWHFVCTRPGAGATFTILDNLQFAQTGAANIFNYALKETVDLPLNARTRYRFVVNNNRTGTTRNMVFRCNHTTLDAVS